MTGGPFRLPPTTVDRLVSRWGGSARGAGGQGVDAIGPAGAAGPGTLVPLWSPRHLAEAAGAARRGAVLLLDEGMSRRAEVSGAPSWVHPFSPWAMAMVLGEVETRPAEPVVASDAVLAAHVVVGSGVVVGRRVRVGPGTVLGGAGFGLAKAPDGSLVAIPHLGGVVIEDDVSIGALCTVDAGTLSPTRIGRGTQIDAHCHIGHNCQIGEACVLAAQCGLAGSVHMGRGVVAGGQVGIADHVRIGEGARLAGKSGVIGDVPAGAVVAGYPAVPRMRWLRAVAGLHRLQRPRP
jgi:UDP-3-O-[3-hydroxymyristoyl] glucosamine N-acyltransferase